MSKLTSKFTDRPASGYRSILTYDTALGHYVTASISGSVNTSAIQRIGLEINKTPVATRTFEASIASGLGRKIGIVTLFNVEGEINEGNDTRNHDAYRTGRNIKSYKHFASNVFRPMIRVSPESFFEEESGDIVNHYASFNSFGFGLFYKTVDEEFKLIPVQDFSKLSPKDLVGSETTTAYPFVFNNNANYDQFLDPSHPNNDGAVDVFEVRRSIANLSISDIQVFGIKADLMAGGVSDTKNGSSVIENKIDLNQDKVDTFAIYDDAQDTLFGSTLFVTRNKKGATEHDKAYPMPGYIDPGKHKLSPFFEDVNYLTGSYEFAKNNLSMLNFLSSSRNRISEIGSRFKSSTCGLVFGESNPLGTDSIAFGGFKK
jgi:hypothetical protein